MTTTPLNKSWILAWPVCLVENIKKQVLHARRRNIRDRGIVAWTTSLKTRHVDRHLNDDKMYAYTL